MPGKYGIEFVNELHIVDGKPGIVFVTAYDQYGILAIRNRFSIIFSSRLTGRNEKDV